MTGPTQAKLQVSTFLANRMPARLVDYRNTWNLSASQLPDPRGYINYEPLVLDKWPMVINVVMGTTKLKVDDYYADNPEYEVTYQMRTYVWVRANGAKAATDMRDNLVTVIRDVLLDHPGLDDASCAYNVKDSTVKEEFSDLTLLKGDRVMAAAFIAYDLTSTEVITRDSLGVVGWGTGKGVVLAVDLMQAVPNAPSLLRAEDKGLGVVDLTWNESTWEGGVVPITGYRVESSIDGGTTWSTSVASTGSRDGFASITGLLIGTAYSFRVAGVNDRGVGATSVSSNEVTLA